MGVKESNRIAVVIPAFCAEKSIKDVIDGLPIGVNFIIVVDDCSPDRTGAIVKSLSDPRIRLICHEQNQGVGGAMLSGYQKACELSADVIIKIDSDGQMDPSYMDPLIQPIINKQADYTKGNRFLHEADLRKMPWQRRIGNLCLSFLTKLASGYWNIFDPTNGYTAISGAIIPIINRERISKRYFFETSMLLELGLLRAVVKDVSMPAVYAGEVSSLSLWKTMIEFPPRLLKGLIRRIIFLYFIRDFNAVTLFLTSGIIGITFGFFWGIDYWIKSSSTGIAATTGTVMIAVLPVILGFQFILQAMVMDVQNVPEDIISDKSYYR